MLSKFGKELRKMRIDGNELLRDMAEKLDMTAAYLSAIETGSRRIPDDLVKKIISAYHCDSATALSLSAAAELSSKTLTIDLENANQNQKMLANSFARKFSSLSEEEIEIFKKLINE